MYQTLIACLLLTCSGVCASGRSLAAQKALSLTKDDTVFDPSFDVFVEDTLRELHIPGLSIAVVDGGKIVSKGYGFAVLPDQAATADTQYFTASTTKAFTAAAAALLVHDDDKYPSLKWTSPISEHIRADFVLEDDYATSHITIEDALSHRTGLPGHDVMLGQANDTPATTVQRIRFLPMTAQPRTQWQYCNMMYAVITHLIQTVTETCLQTLLRERIWLPLGMLSTTFEIPVESSRLARGYYYNPQSGESLGDGDYVPEEYLDLLTTAGDGATISTVKDYALWIKALMNAASEVESWNSSSPITRAIYHDLVNPRAILPVEYQGALQSRPLYALGWFTVQVGGTNLVLHSGQLTGFGTQVYMVPARGYGVITMGNTVGSSNEAGSIIASKLLAEKLNLSAASVTSIRQSLLEVQRVDRHHMHRQRPSPSVLQPLAGSKHIPLPLPLSSAAGLYSHPAYGTMNLTIPSTSSRSTSAKTLEAIFYRTVIAKVVLTHISGTLFKLKYFEAHGLGNIDTGEGIVWEEEPEELNLYAYFELGITGDKVERAGAEVDLDMVETARQKGEKHWKEGMIWFEKV